MNFQDAIDKVTQEIQSNHYKIIDDWCKAYMAQRYIEGKSIDVGSFTLCQQNLSWAQNEIGFKYWFEDRKVDLSIEPPCQVDEKINMEEKLKCFELAWEDMVRLYKEHKSGCDCKYCIKFNKFKHDFDDIFTKVK